MLPIGYSRAAHAPAKPKHQNRPHLGADVAEISDKLPPRRFPPGIPFHAHVPAPNHVPGPIRTKHHREGGVPRRERLSAIVDRRLVILATAGVAPDRVIPILQRRIPGWKPSVHRLASRQEIRPIPPHGHLGRLHSHQREPHRLGIVQEEEQDHRQRIGQRMVLQTTIEQLAKDQRGDPHEQGNEDGHPRRNGRRKGPVLGRQADRRVVQIKRVDRRRRQKVNHPRGHVENHQQEQSRVILPANDGPPVDRTQRPPVHRLDPACRRLRLHRRIQRCGTTADARRLPRRRLDRVLHVTYRARHDECEVATFCCTDWIRVPRYRTVLDATGRARWFTNTGCFDCVDCVDCSPLAGTVRRRYGPRL